MIRYMPSTGTTKHLLSKMKNTMKAKKIKITVNIDCIQK